MKHITIVAPNRLGVVADISSALARHDINIESMDAETFGESGVVILSVDRYDAALSALQALPGLRVISEEAIVIRLKNEPGALARIAERFRGAGINLRSLRFVHREDEYGLVAISTERTEEALALVRDVLVA